MSVGENIRKQREAKGLTQKDLADKLFVTPQAISRWEKDAVEPSVDTLKQMATLFGTSIDELVNDPSADQTAGETQQTSTVVIPLPANETTKEPEETTPAPAPKLLGICIRCGKAIYEGDSFDYGSKMVSHQGRGHHERVSYSLGPDGSGHDLFCQNCIDDLNSAARQASLDRAVAVDSRHHKAWSWSIFAGIVAFLLAILIGILALNNHEVAGGTWTLSLSPLIAYLVFSLVFVLISDNTFVSDVFMEIVSLAFVKMPGVIFSLDFDGVAFLIAVKILFAILGFLLFAFIFLLAVAISGIFSMFMFPVALKRDPNIA
jgi:transcriptional regulator with XRE-family HTH domain